MLTTGSGDIGVATLLYVKMGTTWSLQQQINSPTSDFEYESSVAFSSDGSIMAIGSGGYCRYRYSK